MQCAFRGVGRLWGERELLSTWCTHWGPLWLPESFVIFGESGDAVEFDIVDSPVIGTEGLGEI